MALVAASIRHQEQRPHHVAPLLHGTSETSSPIHSEYLLCQQLTAVVLCRTAKMGTDIHVVSTERAYRCQYFLYQQPATIDRNVWGQSPSFRHRLIHTYITQL